MQNTTFAIVTPRTDFIHRNHCLFSKTWIAALIVSAILLCGCAWSTYPDTNDPNQVAQAFASAMVAHDADSAKKFVIPDLHPKVESWLANHPRYDCPFSWDLDDTIYLGAGYGGMEAGILHMTYWFHCGSYRLTFDDLEILPTGNIWLITEWRQTCQEVNNKRDCDPPEK